jgi:hypothetical protein
MGFLSKLRGAAGAPSSGSAKGFTPPAGPFIGRKFSSNVDLDACLVNFLEAAPQNYPVVGSLVDLQWTTPTASDLRAPERFVALELSTGGQLYLALWNGWSHSSDAGTSREMWFVPPGYDRSPIPMPGTWKMLDGSLSSTGEVEAPLWGG